MGRNQRDDPYEQHKLRINEGSTSENYLDFLSTVNTTGDIITVPSADSLTTGSILNLVSNSSSTGARNLVSIQNANISAVNGTVLALVQDAAERCLFINQDGNGEAINIDSEATTADVIRIVTPATTTGSILSISDADSLTTGKVANFVSDSADTGTRSLVQVTNDNTAATGATCLQLQQDAAQRAIFIDQNGVGNAIEIDMDVNSASDIFAVKIVNDNAGAGVPGGIDLSTFALDEPNMKFVADAITSVGTISHQVAIDIGGTIYYLVAYTHGS